MGDCTFCGESAGFLKSSHVECKNTHDDAVVKIQGIVMSAFESEDDLNGLGATITDLASQSFLSDVELRTTLMHSWTTTVNQRLEQGLISEAHEHRLSQLGRALALPKRELEKTDACNRMVKSGVIQDILNGVIPQRDCVTLDSLPINFQKGETLVWSFPNTGYFMEKTRREYVGGSHGISVRVAVALHVKPDKMPELERETLTA